MKERMYKLDIYNDSAQILEMKTPKKIYSWISILIIFIMIFITFSIINFNVYKTYLAYLDSSGDILVELDYDDFPINKNNILYIKGVKYEYVVKEIIDNNLVLNINLDSGLNIEGNTFNISVLKERTSLFEIAKEKIKKGLGI